MGCSKRWAKWSPHPPPTSKLSVALLREILRPEM